MRREVSVLGKQAGMGMLATATVVLAGSSSASGAVTIGSDLEAPANRMSSCSPSQCTAAHGVLPPTSTAPGGLLAPTAGVVVRWRIKVGDEVTPVAFRITRPGDSPVRTGAGTGPTVTPAANQTSTFDVRLPIQVGDAVGINCCQNAFLEAFADTASAMSPAWTPPLLDGEPPRSTPGFALELLVSADIEPDADKDGFGDETQDLCPTDASKQAECDPPETEITKGAPNKTDRSKVKFKFTSDEPGSSFECKTDKKPFKPCTSPKTVKRLDEGKHKFKVRAVDAAGNVDPTAAKDKFKVVD